jgi:bifunctional non-homologous end joining protein LigD
MLATLTEDRFSDEGWIYERKLDGVRAIVARNGNRVDIFSRNHKSMNASYPELIEAFLAQPVQQFVVDGEIVAFDGEQTSFEKLQARIHQTHPDKIRASGVAVFLYLFDLLDVDDKDITGFPLRDRKQLLRETIDFEDPLRYSEHRNTHGEAFYAEACEKGWEGIIAKRANSRYRVGHRSPDWLKFKCVKDQEMVIGGFTEPQGSRTGFGALLVGYYDGEQLRYAGKVGTGYNRELLHTLRAQLDDLEQDQSPFAEPVKERGAHWVRPELVGQIGFSEWTDDGKLRHPRFQGLRTDKAAAEVVREAR